MGFRVTCTDNTHIQRTSLRYAADVKRSLKRLSLMPRFLQREYFRHTRQRPDRVAIKDEWIECVIENSESEKI